MPFFLIYVTDSGILLLIPCIMIVEQYIIKLGEGMDWFIYFMICIIGMFLASFFNVLAIRLPEKKTLWGRSECPYCHHTLRAIDIVPILGFAVNKGKCHFCSEKISIRYPVVEIIGGLSFVIGYYMFGFSWQYFAYLIVFSVLIVEALMDIEKQIVMDRIWIIGLVPLIVLRIVQKEFFTYLLSSAVLFSTMFLISWVGQKIYKKEALGGGDVKLFIFIGFALTWILGLLSIFFASLFGFIYGITRKDKNNREIPFVPFISTGTVISFLFGNMIIDLYLNLLRM